MRRSLLLSAIVLTALLQAPSHGATAECTQELAQQMFEEATIIEKTSARCRTLSLSRDVDVAQFCSVCGPTIERLLKLEQRVRDNQSCFTVRRQKREIRRLMSKR